MNDKTEEQKRTYFTSTMDQRRYWIHLMLEEKKRTNNAEMNLSSWIASHLPVPVDLEVHEL